jgi:chemotaxis methyl-accepting protein methylase
MAKLSHAISKLGTQLSSQKDKFDSLKEKFESEKSTILTIWKLTCGSGTTPMSRQKQ